MKRLIFSLLYDEGYFILSRNFRRQKIGTLDWILSNYNLLKVSFGLDEIMLLNITKSNKFNEDFLKTVNIIARNCFIPITVGGKIDSVSIADSYFKNGADKVFINNQAFIEPILLTQLGEKFGKQAIVAGVNYIKNRSNYILCDSFGNQKILTPISEHVDLLIHCGVGELVFQSVECDGTGNGLDLDVLRLIPDNTELPIVVMGGVGKSDHIIDGLSHPKVDAVATANLLNFIGQSFLKTRNDAIRTGIELPKFKEDISI